MKGSLMMSDKLRTLIYPKSTQLQYPVVNGIAFSSATRLFVVSSSLQLKFFKINNNNESIEFASFSSFLNTPFNATITDLSWSTVDSTKLAVSFSNGSVVVLTVIESTDKQPVLITQEWSSGKISSSVNKVAWHPNEKHTLASANSDGQVRLFDFRKGVNNVPITAYGHKSSISIRDVAFDPFHPDVFAEVSDNGNLKLWDRRFTDRPVMCKASAHAQPILTLAWHPYLADVIATGSRDKTIRVWDFSQCSLFDSCSHSGKVTHSPVPDTSSHSGSLYPFSFSSSPATSSFMTGHIHTHSSSSHSTGDVTASEPVCLSTLHTSAAVGRIAWRSADENHINHIASIAAQTSLFGTTAVSDAVGCVYIWDTDHPNIPIAILKGHEVAGENCANFAWIESLSNQRDPSLSATATQVSAALTASRGSGKKSMKGNSFLNYQRNLELQQLKAQQLATTQYILSVSASKSGGRILVQDLRLQQSSEGTVVYPHDHISASVVAISSQGDAAFHRGFIPQETRSVAGAIPAILVGPSDAQPGGGSKDAKTGRTSSKANKSNSGAGKFDKRNASDNNNRGGGSNGTNNNGTAVNGGRPRNGSFSGELDELHTGVVVLGLANVDTLEESAGIRKERGAEGGVFDPALIYLLAKSYSLAHSLYGSEEATTRLREGSYSISSSGCNAGCEATGFEASCYLGTACVNANDGTGSVENEQYQAAMREYCEHRRRYDEAVGACNVNLAVARSAALMCRASVWASLAALIPEPVEPRAPRVTPLTTLRTDADLLMEKFLIEPTVIMPNNIANSNVSPLQGKLSETSCGNISHYPAVPFAIDVMAGLLSELLEGGDSQHFVVVCEILRKVRILDAVCAKGGITEFRVRRTYLAYLDLLTKLMLFCEANEIIKASTDSYISKMSRQGVEIHTRCAKCGKELTEKSSTAWCLKCARCVCMCVLCNKPVRGLLHWCPVCGHGGHLECAKKWFKISNTCPSGCGHDCCSTLVELCREASSESKTSSNNHNNSISKSAELEAASSVRSRRAQTVQSGGLSAKLQEAQSAKTTVSSRSGKVGSRASSRSEADASPMFPLFSDMYFGSVGATSTNSNTQRPASNSRR